jgi:hypothetical protein
MKTMLFLLGFVSALTAWAGDPPAQFSSTVRAGIPITPGERQVEFMFARRAAPVIALGKSDFVLGGPLVAGFRRLPYQADLSRGQKFLRLPIIRLFVPGPMENPPGGTGKYFAWRNEDSASAWTVAASRPAVSKGAGVRMEPVSALIQLHK